MDLLKLARFSFLVIVPGYLLSREWNLQWFPSDFENLQFPLRFIAVLSLFDFKFDFLIIDDPKLFLLLMCLFMIYTLFLVTGIPVSQKPFRLCLSCLLWIRIWIAVGIMCCCFFVFGRERKNDGWRETDWEKMGRAEEEDRERLIS